MSVALVGSIIGEGGAGFCWSLSSIDSQMDGSLSLRHAGSSGEEFVYIGSDDTLLF